MRLYGSIHTKFWVNPEIQKLSVHAKLLATYLLTSPHTNMLGCFRVTVGYIAEDLQWENNIIKKALGELSKIHFLTYDATYSWAFIINFLKYNPIENPNQGKNIAKLYHDVPQYVSFFPQLICKILEQKTHLQQSFINTLATLSEPSLNQDQNQNQNQNQELSMSGKPDAFLSSFDKKNEQSKEEDAAEQQNDASSDDDEDEKLPLKDQALAILQFLNTKTGRVYRPVETNLKLIEARLKSGATRQDCFQVIAKKTREWRGNPKMDEYLRPATLFNATKFEQYMGELVIPGGNSNE